MIKRPHCCAFILGTALVLLAALLVLRVHSGPDQRAANTAHLAQAVSRLDGGCAICHSASTGAPRLVTARAFPAPQVFAAPQTQPVVQTARFLPGSNASSWSDLPVSTSVSVQNTAPSRIDAALLDLGWRLLSLPDREQARAGDAISAYVALVDATRARSDLNPGGSALAQWSTSEESAFLQIRHLAAWIRALEQRAQPVQWDRPSALSCPPITAAIPHAPLTLPLLLDLPAHWDMTRAVSWIASEPPDLGLAYEVIFGTQRRGPPADAAFVSILDSVLGMRDCASLSGSLSFLCRRQPSTQQQHARQTAASLAPWTPARWIYPIL